MTNSQDWLNINYPNKEETKEIEIDNSEQIQGSLIISDYPNLETIDIRDQNNLTQLQINNCPKLKKLSVYYSKLTNLDLTELINLEKLSLSENSLTNLNLINNKKLKYLYIWNNNLTNLNINSQDLEELNVQNNKLTELNINNCINLKRIYCFDNNLTNLDLSNNLLLEWLDIKNNNFTEQDLSFISHLVNLKRLELGNNDQERINQNIYNRFKGSLEPLKNMNKLEILFIDDTDIDSGLEYLPDSVKYFECSVYYRKDDAKVKAIEQELQKQKWFYETGIDNITLHQRWKQANFPKLNQQKLQDQLKLLQEEKAKLEELNQKLLARIPFLEKQIEESEFLIKEQKEKIVNDYLLKFTEEEQEALEKLIKVHKDYLEAKKLREESNELFEQLFAIRQKLKVKLGEKFIESIELILTNFEELYQKEWNLTKQLKEKDQAIESKQLIEETIEKNKQSLHNLTINVNVEGNLLLENINSSNSNLTIQAPFKEQDNEDSWLVTQLKERKMLDQEEIDQVNNFLQAKKVFLDARQQTIEELKKCCDKLEKKYSKQEIIGEASSIVSGFGAIPITLGIPQVIGESIKAGSNFWKRKLSSKSSKEFHFSLGGENELTQVDNVYKGLVKVLDLKDIGEKKLFSAKYKVFDILTKDGIWENRSLNLERMERVIISLGANLELLKEELEKEEKEFKEISEKLGQEQVAQIIHNPPKTN